MIAKKDLIAQLKNVPQEIVELMLDRQEEQGNVRDVKVFQERIDAPKNAGGLSWYRAPEGPSFWSSIINHNRYDLYWKVYPNGHKDGIMDMLNEEESASTEPVTEETPLPIPPIGSSVVVTSGGRTLRKVVVGNVGSRVLTIGNTSWKRLQKGENTNTVITVHKDWEIYSEVIELTLKDISEGKGVGVDPSRIKIIK